jgi:hypothetical protein
MVMHAAVTIIIIFWRRLAVFVNFTRFFPGTVTA